MTISMVIWLNNWEPDSYYDKILINRINGLHTLCLLGEKIIINCILFFLDIKTKEQSIDNIIRLIFI